MEVIDLCDLSRDDSENAVIDIDGISTFTRVAKAPPSASSVVNLVDSDDEASNNSSLRRNRKRPRPEANINSILDVKPPAKPPVSDEIEVCQVKQAPKTAFERVREVIPDVDRVHAQKLLFEHRDNVDVVLSILVEKGYPRNKDSGFNNAASGSLSLTLKSNLNPTNNLDFYSTSSFEPSDQYLQQALGLLEYEFPFIRHDSIKSWLKDHKGHYTLVRQQIENALAGKEENKAASEEVEYKQYLLLSEAKAIKRSSPRQTKRIGAEHVLQQPRRNRKSPEVKESILQQEVKNYNLRYKEWVETVRARQRRSEARKKSQVSGTALECSCCFDQVSIEEMVACKDEGHLFCIDCIKGYAENQIFGNGSLGTNNVTKKPATALLCCHSSGCQSQFQDDHLMKALPKKTLEKYNELQFRAVMEQAEIFLCTCPKCGFQADVPETQMIFQCPIEGCKYESCRKCGKPPHIPLKCDEVVKQKREDEGRLKVEEAITRAKLRTCSKCHISFVKSDGCNKMTCRCGLKMCYICRQPLPKNDPYSHFCNTPHCTHKSCGKCTLYSNDKEDDARAMREAGVDAAATYREQLLQEDDKVEINLDVDKILGPKTPPKHVQSKRR